MKKLLAALAALLLLGLAACGDQPTEDAFYVQIICESEDIYQIFWSCYLDGAYYGMGGVADLDGNALTADSELLITFSRDYLDGNDDLADFAMDLSPYGKEDTSEIATTDRVSIPAEYGQTYTVVFSGSREDGFRAVLRQ